MKLILSLLKNFSFRHWRRHPGEWLLVFLIVSLGVASWSAIQMANRSALAGFESFVQEINPESDGIIRPEAGILNATHLREVRQQLEGLPIRLFPIREVWMDDLPQLGAGEKVLLLGVDLRQMAVMATRENPDLADVLEEGNEGEKPAIYATAASWERFGPPYGETLALGGMDWNPLTLPQTGFQLASDNVWVLAITDLDQAFPETRGQYSRIEWVAEGSDTTRDLWKQQAYERLENSLSGTWRNVPPDESRQSGQAMSKAFRLNLTVLSLLGLLVGFSLIIQAMEGTVTRRRPEIATLRSLGVPGPTIRSLFLVEGILMGLAGGLCGFFLGLFGSGVASQMVSQSFSALYGPVASGESHWAAADLWGSVGLGVVFCLTGSGYPALRAMQIPAAQLQRSHRWVQPEGDRLRWVLVLITAVACPILFSLPGLPTGENRVFPLAGYLGALVLIVGVSALFVQGLARFTRWRHDVRKNSPASSLALSRLRYPGNRHALMITGLVLASGMTSAMLFLMGSFRTTVEQWTANTLRDDLYLTASEPTGAVPGRPIPERIWKDLVEVIQPQSHSLFQSHFIRFRGSSTQLSGIHWDWLQNHPDFPWIQAPQQWDPNKSAIISESFQRRYRVGMGDTLELPTPKGPIPIQITGVFADYGREAGVVHLPFERVAKAFGTRHTDSISFRLQPGMSPREGAALIRAHMPNDYHLQNSGELRDKVLTVFHQTFSITYALQAIGVMVALLGLGLGLSASFLDRKEEERRLHFIGLQHAARKKAMIMEAALTALTGSLGGLSLGLGLGWVLIHVINTQSFGWTLMTVIPWSTLIAFAVLLSAFGTLTGWWLAGKPR